MSFLNLWALWIAAGVVPVLLLLYFLKLRRRSETVSSTFLWKRAVQDLQVNAPFQKLRKNLLLLLQLLVLAAAIIALMRPIVSGLEAQAERVVMLIDQSASMNTREEGGQTRLEIAKEQAIRRVRAYNRRGSSWLSFWGAEPKTQIMVVAFADRASVITPFTSTVSEVVQQIERIEPTDAQTDMSEAMNLAEAYMAPPSMITQGMEDTPTSSEKPAEVLIFSDGAVPDAAELVTKTEQIEWIPIGTARDNVGITTLRTYRNHEQPDLLETFYEVSNYGPETIKTDVSVYVDDQLVHVDTLTLEGLPEPPAGDPATQPARAALPERTSVSRNFVQALDRAGVLEVRLARPDSLAADNRAWAVVPAPRKLRVLVVTEGNPFLDAAIADMPLAERRFIRPAQFETEVPATADGVALYDVVIFDKVAPESLPAGNYLFFRALPPLEGLSEAGKLGGQRPIWWDDNHAVLRHVNLDPVVVFDGLDWELPEDAESLIEGPSGPMLARYSTESHNMLLVSFAIEHTNREFFMRPAFPIFMYNAIRFLGSGGGPERGPTRPGATLRFALGTGADAATVLTPDQRTERVQADPNGVVRFSGTRRVGVYRIEDGPVGRDRFAVNLEDRHESNVTPPGVFRIGANVKVETGNLIRESTPEIWRWFVGAALLVVMLEWWVYNRRVMI